MIDSDAKYFGRKKGKSFQRLSKYQNLLFKPSTVFFESLSKKKLSLEIGIGDGKKILRDASKNTRTIFIGCDIFIDGILRAARYKHENNIKNLYVFHTNIQDLIPKLKDNSLYNLRIYFPDPWPKNRHKKRRTLSKELMELLIPKMKKNSIFDFATDHGDYYLEALCLIAKYGFKFECNGPNMWQYSFLNQIGTKYEKKALDKNNKLFYFSVLKGN